MADRGRSEVYASETAAFDGTDLETVRPLDSVRAVIDTIIAGEWWPGPSVRVAVTRADSASSCARTLGDGAVEIRLATPQATWATAAHELAHALAGVDRGHGPVFRRAYLDVVEELTNVAVGERRGRLHVDQLADAFAAAGLAVGERAWPAPTSGAPFAL